MGLRVHMGGWTPDPLFIYLKMFSLVVSPTIEMLFKEISATCSLPILGLHVFLLDLKYICT